MCFILASSVGSVHFLPNNVFTDFSIDQIKVVWAGEKYKKFNLTICIRRPSSKVIHVHEIPSYKNRCKISLFSLASLVIVSYIFSSFWNVRKFGKMFLKYVGSRFLLCLRLESSSTYLAISFKNILISLVFLIS